MSSRVLRVEPVSQQLPAVVNPSECRSPGRNYTEPRLDWTGRPWASSTQTARFAVAQQPGSVRLGGALNRFCAEWTRLIESFRGIRLPSPTTMLARPIRAHPITSTWGLGQACVARAGTSPVPGTEATVQPSPRAFGSRGSWPLLLAGEVVGHDGRDGPRAADLPTPPGTRAWPPHSGGRSSSSRGCPRATRLHRASTGSAADRPARANECPGAAPSPPPAPRRSRAPRHQIRHTSSASSGWASGTLAGRRVNLVCEPPNGPSDTLLDAVTLRGWGRQVHEGPSRPSQQTATATRAHRPPWGGRVGGRA